MTLTKEECQIAWNTIKDLNDYPIQCTTNETQDKFQTIPFVELFSDEITLIDNLIKEHFDNPIFTSQKHRQMYDCYKKVIERCAMQSEVIKELNDQLSKYDEWEMRQVQVRTNQPLKREEIHDMVSEITEKSVAIYDNEMKCYIELYLDQEGGLYYFHFGNECESLFVFEDNRFYRREVQDE